MARRKPPTFWTRCRFRLEAALLGSLAAVLPLLSRRLLLRLANGLGSLAYRVLSRERQIAMANLDIAFGNTKSVAAKQRIARSSFQNFARSFLGLFWSQRLSAADLDNWIEFDPENVERLRAALAEGKGLVAIALHYGDWELLALATARFGVPMTIVAEQTQNPHLERLFYRLRSRLGNTTLLQRFALPKLFKALKRGQCIALLIDLNAPQGRGGVWLQFFGLPVFNNSAAAALALHTGAPIIGGVAYPLPNGKVRIVYGEPIRITPTGDKVADLESASQRCLDYCQEIIREQPEFWLWFYRRWKFRTSPEQGRFPYYSIYFDKLRLPRAQRASVAQSTSAPQQSGP